jgi:hypothetical protein
MEQWPRRRAHMPGEGFARGTAMVQWVDRFGRITQRGIRLGKEGKDSCLVVAQRRPGAGGSLGQNERGKTRWGRRHGSRPGQTRPMASASRTPRRSHGNKSLDSVWGSAAGMGEGRRWDGREGWDGRAGVWSIGSSRKQPDPESSTAEVKSQDMAWGGSGSRRAGSL